MPSPSPDPPPWRPRRDHRPFFVARPPSSSSVEFYRALGILREDDYGYGGRGVVYAYNSTDASGQLTTGQYVMLRTAPLVFEVHFVQRPADDTGGMTVADLEGYYKQARAVWCRWCNRRMSESSNLLRNERNTTTTTAATPRAIN